MNRRHLSSLDLEVRRAAWAERLRNVRRSWPDWWVDLVVDRRFP